MASRRRPVRSSVQLLVMLPIGLAVGIVATLAGTALHGALLGWDAAAAVYLLWRHWTLWHLDATATAEFAAEEDPGPLDAEAVIVLACVASLVAVGAILVSARSEARAAALVQAGIAVVSVALSWAVVHTVFAGRYARLYYSGRDGGIDFNQTEPPRHRDFTYVAFTIGTTYQVSDTNVTDTVLRSTVLRHMLLSYLFGGVILAVTINLIAGAAR